MAETLLMSPWAPRAEEAKTIEEFDFRLQPDPDARKVPELAASASLW